MARVVLDANVFVSATFGGIPLQAVTLAFRHELYISPSIKAELLDLPSHLRKKLTSDQIVRMRRLFHVLTHKAHFCEPNQKLTLCRDPKDDTYLTLCLASQADYLVTGDQDLLTISKNKLQEAGLAKLSIITPNKFVKLMRAH